MAKKRGRQDFDSAAVEMNKKQRTEDAPALSNGMNPDRLRHLGEHYARKGSTVVGARSREDVLNAGMAAAGVESHVSEDEQPAEVPVDDAAVKEEKERKAKRKQEKRERAAAKAAASQAAVTVAADVNGDADELSKEEKKKRRKEEKRAKAAAEQPTTEETIEAPAVNGHAAEPSQERKKSKKRDRAEAETVSGAQEDQAPVVNGDDAAVSKEEKKRRKLEKKQQKQAVAASTTETPVSAPLAAPISTNGYEQGAALTALPESEVKSFSDTNFITFTGSGAELLRPILKFQHLPEDCRNASVFGGFDKPTPVQSSAWPFLLSGRDVVGIAETGSGKTLAFGLPCIRHVQAKIGKKSSKSSKVRAVIVSPTRELAMQIQEQMSKLVADTSLRVVCIYGGVPKDPQRAELLKSQIVIATPGRLMDFINEGAADLSSVSYFVLDEADRMLDKGFEQDIRKIAGAMPREQAQTAMFTATWPESIRALAEQFMRDPVRIAIGDNPTGDLRANVRVEQRVEVIDQREKEQRLLQLLKTHQSGKKSTDRILVFCLYKKEASRIEGFIRSRGFPVAGIHGDLSQDQRTKALASFRDGSVPLLVATDVAARGLDIPAVKVVINVTFPLTAEDYVHRIGRTGRAGQEGLAITFFTEHDKGLSGALINVLRAAKQPVPEDLLKFGGTVKKKQHDAYGSFFKDTGDMKAATKITF